jgi:hypothetical protein
MNEDGQRPTRNSVVPNAKEISKEEFLELLRRMLKSVEAGELTQGSVFYKWGEPGMYLAEVAMDEDAQRSNPDSIAPNGRQVSKEELLGCLTDIVRLIEANDSMEGRISFESPEPDAPLVEARVRTGNSMGQGGVMSL